LNYESGRVVTYLKTVIYSLPAGTEGKHRTTSVIIFVSSKTQLFQFHPLDLDVQFLSNLRPVRLSSVSVTFLCPLGLISGQLKTDYGSLGFILAPHVDYVFGVNSVLTSEFSGCASQSAAGPQILVTIKIY
jgi:hypothetical protein